jgi:hypothetical protein
MIMASLIRANLGNHCCSISSVTLRIDVNHQIDVTQLTSTHFLYGSKGREIIGSLEPMKTWRWLSRERIS